MPHGDPANRFDRERRLCAVLAAALAVLLAGYTVLLEVTAQDPAAGSSSDVLLMSGVLAGVSSAGIVAAVRPSQCLGLLSPRKRRESSRGLPERPEGVPSFPLVAHHCSCGRFGDHTLRLGGRTLCAGCLGMAAGGAGGIGLAFASGAGLLLLDGTAGLAAALLGVAAAAVGLALLYRRSPPGWHAAANLALVTGAALLALLLARRGIEAGAFGLLGALAIVGLRIEMSRWRHLSIYEGCPWQKGCRGTSALEDARWPTRR